MATCQGCRGDSFAIRTRHKPTGTMDLYWLCEACRPNPTALARKPRGLAYYRKLTYQIVMPIMLMIFALIELGVHL
jgi:hypothetical protein